MHCRNDSIVGVTNGYHSDAGAHVDELVAVNISHDGVVRIIDEDRQQSANTSRDNLLAALLHLCGDRTRNWGYQNSLLLKAHERSLSPVTLLSAHQMLRSSGECEKFWFSGPPDLSGLRP